MGRLVSSAAMRRLACCLLFCGLQGRKASVYIYHRPQPFANRKASFFFFFLLSINISRHRNPLGI